HWVWVPAFAVVLVCGPLMGFTWASNTESRGIPLRVMTYNVQSAVGSSLGIIIQEISAAQADIVCLQDAPVSPEQLFEKHGWQLATFGQFAIVSRSPIQGFQVGDVSYRTETHPYLRAEIDVGGRRVTVVAVHFETPRDALASLRRVRHWQESIAYMQLNV